MVVESASNIAEDNPQGFCSMNTMQKISKIFFIGVWNYIDYCGDQNNFKM